MELTLRLASAADMAAILRIAEASFAPYVARIGRRPAPMDADYGALVGAGRVLAAELEGRIVGFAAWYRQGAAAALETVAVDPAAQGRGIGVALIAAVESAALEGGAAALELYTHERMSEPLRLYPRLGYVETERREEDGFSRVYFRKALVR